MMLFYFYVLIYLFLYVLFCSALFFIVESVRFVYNNYNLCRYI